MKRKFSRLTGDLAVSRIMYELEPWVFKWQVVGSLGRREASIGDIDILVQPKILPTIESNISEIRQILKGSGKWKRGGSRLMTVTDLFEISDLTLDLFLCHPPAQWGVLVGVRLNPPEFVIWAKKKLGSMGYMRGCGTIHDKTGREVKVRTEEDWFKLLGIEVPPANQRNSLLELIKDV